jgi:2-octaprenylphenol hydroxylase
MITHKKYDLIIIGGGIVGLTLANLLPRELRVALIDNQTPNLKKENNLYDLRVSAINHFSQEQFKLIDAWQWMQPYASSFRNMQVWDKKGKGEISFNCFEIAQPNLGHIIENCVIRHALLQQLQQKDVEIIAPAQPESLTHEANTITLKLNNGQDLQSRLLIGADGVNSWLREQANVELHQWSYHHQALVTTVKTELPHQQTARQVFLPEGVLAFLPLRDDYHCSIVWSVDNSKAQKIAKMSDVQFNEIITETFANKLGQVTKMDRLLSFPLTMRHAKQYIRPQIALVGDAIHTIHPLAGQGVNLGIADACCLASVITAVHKKNRDIGSYHNLRRYERTRLGPNWLMIGIMEGFKHLFASELSSLIETRSLGLNMVNKTQILKNFFIRHALG